MRAESPSKVEHVYRTLLDRLASGQCAVGDCLPTEFDLAAEFDCGRNTVSQAITRLVHEGMVERRRRVGTRVLRSTPRPEPSSVELDAFAFIYPSDRHEGIWRTVNGFQQAARVADRRVVTLTMGTDYEKEIELLFRMGEFDVKAAAIYPVIPSPDIQLRLSRRLIESKFPIVLADLTLPGLGRPSVVVDNFHAGYSMTRCLLERGVSRIGFISEHSWAPSVVERHRGYLWALEEAGRVARPQDVLFGPDVSPDFEDPLRAPMAVSRQFLDQARGVEGVVCAHDVLARGFIHVAQERGLRVPQDIKVTGVDDISAQFPGEIPLTTYRVPFEEMGRTLFNVLDSTWRQQPLAVWETRVRGEVVVRETV